jgi:hypothetical protein
MIILENYSLQKRISQKLENANLGFRDGFSFKISTYCRIARARVFARDIAVNGSFSAWTRLGGSCEERSMVHLREVTV